MTETHHVQEFCRRIWSQRETRTLPRDPVEISRRLALVIANQVSATEGYDPEMDVRVRWARAVIEIKRRLPWMRAPRADADLEFAAAYALGRLAAPETCGKDRAAETSAA